MSNKKAKTATVKAGQASEAIQAALQEAEKKREILSGTKKKEKSE